ncbi:conserved hypothetical protein [Trichinella spiralis]|uniref:hypothetical protein n=1 Tax=Trichinella spiralis TaxID=6334 RepID=UPI0001EFC0C7|nr:conserved hypothetical protein [Trichinella spiralis]
MQNNRKFNEFFLQFQCEGVNSDAQVLMQAGVGLKFSPDELVYGGRCNQTRRLANNITNKLKLFLLAKIQACAKDVTG